MSLEKEIYDLTHWVKGLEDGSLHIADALTQAKGFDPAAVFLLTRFLREKHKNADPVSARILARIVELSTMYPEFIKICKDGDKDPISEWFMETYKFSEFFNHPEKMAELIVEKLEG
jgi:hypothetical protein